MNNDRIAAIRERCEAIEITTPSKAAKDLMQAKKDIADLLTEIDRLTAELADLRADYNGVMRIQAELLHDKQCLNSRLEASQRREQAAADAVNRMAEYIVTKGRVDDMLCDDIPQKLHLKHQPKNDGNYDNGPCIKCVAEYFMSVPNQEGGE